MVRLIMARLDLRVGFALKDCGICQSDDLGFGIITDFF